MNARFLPLLVFLVLASFCRLPAQTTHGSTAQTSGPDFCREVEKETFLLINQYRETAKLTPLVWDGTIGQVARAHSKDMATGEVDFGHDGFRDRISHLRGVMTGVRGAGENVLMTTDLDAVAQGAVASWLRSPHHLENIRGNYNYSGLGVWQNQDGTLYFTQIFVNIVPPTAETQSVPPALVTPFGMLTTAPTRSSR